MASGRIKGITIEIGGDTTKLGKALSEVEQKSKGLQSELKGINSLLKFDPKNTELLSQKQKVLTQAIGETKDKLNLLKEAQKQAQAQFERGEITEEQYRDLQREIVNTENKLKSLTNELKEFGSVSAQKVAAVGDKMQKVGNDVTEAGNKLKGASATAGIAIGGVVKAASDWETAFTGVRKTVDGTDEQLSKLEQGLLDLSKETGSSATDIAAVAEAAGQLGIKTENVLDFTKVMVELGDTTNLSAEEAASSLAKLVNITGMSSDKYSNLGSAIVDLGNNFATTESDIVNMTTRLASTGNVVGLTEPQMLAVGTALSSVGIEAEAGGSAISKLLKKMETSVATYDQSQKAIKSTGYSLRDLQLMAANNTKDFKAVADSVGLTSDELKGFMNNASGLEKFAQVSGKSAEEFKQAYEKDAVGALSMFINGLSDVDKQGGSAVATLQDMGLTEVRMSNAVLSLASSDDILGKALETSNKAFGENTALSEEAEKKYATTEAKVEQLKNTAIELATKLGDILLPIVQKVIEHAKGIIEKITNMSPATQKLIVVITGLVAGLSPVLTIVGKLISSVGSILKVVPKLFSVGKTIAGFLPKLGGLVKGLFAVIQANPVMAAVGAIIGTLVLLYNHCEPFKKFVDDLWAKIKEIFGNFPEWIKEKFEKVKQGFHDLKENIAGKFDEIKTSVSEKFGKVKEVMGNVMTAAKDTVSEKLNNIKTAYDEHGGGISGAVAAAYEGVKGHFTAGLTFVDNLTGGKLTDIKNKFTEKMESAKESAREKLEGIKTHFKDKMEASKQVMKEKLDGVKTNITNVLTTAGNNAKEKLDRMKNAYKEHGGGVQGIVAGMMSMTKSLYSSGFNLIDNITGGKLSAIKNKFSSTMDSAKTIVNNALNSIKGFFSKLKLSLPKFKLPHFKLSGSFSISPPSVPHVAVDWYAKAMNDGMILNQPTIFGINKSGQFMGGGEAGPEAIVGTHSLREMIDASVTSALKRIEIPVYVDSTKLVSSTVNKYDTALGILSAKKAKGY